jgi:putative flippase GtrA
MLRRLPALFLGMIPERFRPEAGRLVRFGLVGAANTAVDYAAWALLFYAAGWPLLLCQAVGYTIGVVNSFVLNSFWTFRARRLAFPRFLRFLLVNGVSLGASLGLIVLFASFLPPVAAKTVTVVFTISINYFGSKLFVFATRERGQDPGPGSVTR